jgi:hypothetical protein
MKAPQRRRILAAVAPEALPELRAALEGPAEVIAAHRLYDALQRMRAERPDLVVCGVDFDESRMFDLLRVSKTEFPDVPSSPAAYSTRNFRASRSRRSRSPPPASGRAASSTFPSCRSASARTGVTSSSATWSSATCPGRADPGTAVNARCA